MRGNNVDNTMSKNDRQLARELAELTATAISNGAVVETIPAVETDEQADAETELSGRTLPVRDVVSHVTMSQGKASNLLRIDLDALRGHRVSDVTSIVGQGD